MDSMLYASEKLVDVLSQENICVIDCRYKLSDNDWGIQQYLDGHIPGAFYANLREDLSSPATAFSGRHPLPDFTEFSQKLSNWNITPETHVILYDQENCSLAAGRLWWLLRYVGHTSVSILDGGYARWKEMGFPVSTTIPRSDEKLFTPYPCRLQANMLASTPLVYSVLNDEKFILIDTRANDRFHGENETLDTVGGHIPGAINRFHKNNLTEDGNYRNPIDLHKELSDLVSGHSIENTIIYCGAGLVACNVIFAFAYSGTGMPRLYVGSWSEWIRDSTRPIAR